MSIPSDVATGAVRGGTAILFAALGETISERAGVVNLGTEGSMLMGALAAYAVTSITGNPWIGVLAGAAAGGALSCVHAYFVLKRGANQLATGLVVLFLALGITSLFGATYVKAEINSFTPWAIPGLSSIPVVGDILFNHDPLTYLSFLLVPIVGQPGKGRNEPPTPKPPPAPSPAATPVPRRRPAHLAGTCTCAECA